MYRGLCITVLLLTLLCGCSEQDSSTTQENSYAPPASQWPEDMENCLTDLGWDVEIGSDGRISIRQLPNEQVDQYNEDMRQCESQYGYDLPREPISAEQAEEIWDRFLDAATCIENLGYAVEDPPSRESAIEALQQVPIDLGWDPMQQVKLTGSDSDLDQAYSECDIPQL
ncbi:hypothetical protein [Glycomyces salinus]|uniref:hypothetical protein n=1 Tax=Glycomyces salinus TaxID=980294 RepID=UPI0018EAE718|nr:hypothetical protein [Glycomyces salinus]